MIDGAHHRRHSGTQKGIKGGRIDSLDIAYKAVVDGCGGPLLGCKGIAVGAGKAYRVAAVFLKRGHDGLVDEAGVHRRHYLKGVGVGYAATFYHDGFDAHLLEGTAGELRDDFSARSKILGEFAVFVSGEKKLKKTEDGADI